MKVDRIFQSIKYWLKSSAKMVEQENLYGHDSESVGTIRIKDVLDDDENPGYEAVILEFSGSTFEDNSAFIAHVPEGTIKKDQIAEIIVRKIEGLDKPDSCLVSLRPFVPNRYGKPFSWEEANLVGVFIYNEKHRDSSPRFFKKFFP